MGVGLPQVSKGAENSKLDYAGTAVLDILQASIYLMLHMFAILYLGDSKLDCWTINLHFNEKPNDVVPPFRPGEHRLQ